MIHECNNNKEDILSVPHTFVLSENLVPIMFSVDN